MFKEFQDGKVDIPKEKIFYEVPICYRTINIEFNEALFMDDLKLKGFEMFDRHKEITIDHAVLVMKVLGKLHAVSYAMRVPLVLIRIRKKKKV